MRRAAARPPILPGFEYLEVLGSGGFADVFLYEQDLPRRKVAVKVLLLEGLSAATRKRFADEANVMATLSAHPNIVTIHHADISSDGRPFIVMEYCPGPTMSARHKAAPFPVEEALRVGVRLSSAVATAHASGVLHRDIKPSNVLVTEFGAPALTDFGIASTTADAGAGRSIDGEATEPDALIGLSVPWSAPELFTEAPRPDVRSDVFSLAATVYTLLAGRSPFEVAGGPNSSADLTMRITRGSITPLDRLDVPASLVAALRRGMASDPDERWQRATDFGRALQAVELELGYQSTPLDVPTRATPWPVAVDEGEPTRATGPRIVAAQADVVDTRADARAADPADPGVEIDSHDQTVRRVTEPTVPNRDAARPPRRRRAPWIVAAAITVLVVGGAITAIALAPRAQVYTPADATATAPSAPPPGGVIVPAPELNDPVRSEDGTAVEFTWSNPDGVPGDQYVWRLGETGALGDAHPTRLMEVVIESVSPDERVCISVWVNRDGQLSSEPAVGCSP